MSTWTPPQMASFAAAKWELVGVATLTAPGFASESRREIVPKARTLNPRPPPPSPPPRQPRPSRAPPGGRSPPVFASPVRLVRLDAPPPIDVPRERLDP